MIKSQTIKLHAKKNRSITTYLISTGLVILLSLIAPQTFCKSKTNKKLNTIAVKTSKHEIVKPTQSVKTDNKLTKTSIISKKQIKHLRTLKTADSKSKQKIKSINYAKLSGKHDFTKAKHHSNKIAIKNKSDINVAALTLVSELSENNERIDSLLKPNANEIILSHEMPVNNAIIGPTSSVHGVIDQSLVESATNAGLTNELIEQLTSIFAWDIDFANNLDQGDKFTIVYEQGVDQSDAQIVAAEFTNRGRILTALRYITPDGTMNYFSPEGKPMRKAFLSAPLDYLKISSGFSTHRRHPILNRIRAHKGVDYAARTGTPVKSAGDGEVSFAGNQGGFGQMLIVKHGEHYETVYAHLSDFKDGLTAGDTVKQGEVIGYVGQSGLATGPHLHYEFRVDGEHRNPETLNTAQTAPLHDEILADFKDQTKPHFNQLNKTKAQSLLARN